MLVGCGQKLYVEVIIFSVFSVFAEKMENPRDSQIFLKKSDYLGDFWLFSREGRGPLSFYEFFVIFHRLLDR